MKSAETLPGSRHRSGGGRPHDAEVPPQLAGSTPAGLSSRHFLTELTRLAGKVSRDIDALEHVVSTDAVHRLRVDSLELRNGLRSFAPPYSPWRLQQMDHDLRWLRSRLAAARDLDVLMAERIIRTDRTRGARRLRELVKAERLRIADRVSGVVRTRRCESLQDELQEFANTDFALPTGSTEFDLAEANQELNRQLRILLAHGREADGGRKVMHALRKAARRLYFSCLLVTGIYGADANHYIEMLAAIQHRLGKINDAAFERRRLHKLGKLSGPAAAAAKHLRSKLSSRHRHQERKFQKEWDAFAKARPFWRKPH